MTKRSPSPEKTVTPFPTERQRAIAMLIEAGVTMGVLLFSRIFLLLKPLFNLVYYATLTTVLYYILLIIVFTVFVVFLCRYTKRRCGYNPLAVGTRPVGIRRTLAIIGLGAFAVLMISIGLGFKTKVQVEMGTGVTMATALINIAVYFYYGLHLWLGLIAAALVQRGMEILLPTPRTIPWGAIFLVTVFGLSEFLLEAVATTHMFPWVYYLLTYVYAAIYELSGRSFHLTYWSCIIILVL